MTVRILSAFILVTALSAMGIAQGLPPLGQPPSQQPAQGLPPLGPANEHGPAPGSTLSVDAANADLKAARAANQEKRYADAEALMLKDTASQPKMVYLWLELGNAQLGLKKYDDAEASFKAALSNGESAQKAAPSAGFYSSDNRTVAHASGGATPPPTKATDVHDLQGAAWAGLGEAYVHLNHIPEAKDAFDKAIASNPLQSALYLRNETILFLQAGDYADQVETANKAIAADPMRAALYFFKGQGLAAQATIDPKTQKMVLPAGCAEALQKYLDMEPSGQYSADAKGILAAAGVPLKAGKK
jgi:tetratricopeptide (TPR) repeat protein